MKYPNQTELRVYIAEKCGWSFYPPFPIDESKTLERKLHATACWLNPESYWGDFEELPDYTGDLNWMAKAEEFLTNKEAIAYMSKLREIRVNKNIQGPKCNVAFSSALERAQAFYEVTNNE
jgi:hypothetical protein